MINRIVLVGRVTRAPKLNPDTGCTTLRLEVSHPTLAEVGAPAERTPVEVEVLVRSRRRAEVLERYLDVQRPLLVSGHLAPAAEVTRVELEDWQFLNDDLVHVDLREEAFNSPAGSARAAA